ncbi:hypothetical protein PHMEG_00018186 [Phytophthora megakarya]|uniref:CCHC-type domain-containing protein n=1 Tax=Phytophthora megakarya TaxID=4795 RepID=A0A225VUY1_9STRA|nr:hypothetical protein PHMEG_00018186 [Phytophthora megakarya]
MAGTAGQTAVIPGIGTVNMSTELRSDMLGQLTPQTDMGPLALFTNPKGLYNEFTGIWVKPPGRTWNSMFWEEQKKKKPVKASPVVATHTDAKKPTMKTKPREKEESSSESDVKPVRKKLKAPVKQVAIAEQSVGAQQKQNHQMPGFYRLDPSSPRCFNCGQFGHWANVCTRVRRRRMRRTERVGYEVLGVSERRSSDGRSGEEGSESRRANLMEVQHNEFLEQREKREMTSKAVVTRVMTKEEVLRELRAEVVARDRERATRYVETVRPAMAPVRFDPDARVEQLQSGRDDDAAAEEERDVSPTGEGAELKNVSSTGEGASRMDVSMMVNVPSTRDGTNDVDDKNNDGVVDAYKLSDDNIAAIRLARRRACKQRKPVVDVTGVQRSVKLDSGARFTVAGTKWSLATKWRAKLLLISLRVSVVCYSTWWASGGVDFMRGRAAVMDFDHNELRYKEGMKTVMVPFRTFEGQTRDLYTQFENFTTPTNAKEVKRFVHLAGYYRRISDDTTDAGVHDDTEYDDTHEYYDAIKYDDADKCINEHERECDQYVANNDATEDDEQPTTSGDEASDDSASDEAGVYDDEEEADVADYDGKPTSTSAEKKRRDHPAYYGAEEMTLQLTDGTIVAAQSRSRLVQKMLSSKKYRGMNVVKNFGLVLIETVNGMRVILPPELWSVAFKESHDSVWAGTTYLRANFESVLVVLLTIGSTTLGSRVAAVRHARAK